MARTWSNRKDGLNLYYTNDGVLPQLGVRLEYVDIMGASDWRWIGYVGDIQVPALCWSRHAAQEEAEKYWAAHYSKSNALPD
jgi:hypothetical protein